MEALSRFRRCLESRGVLQVTGRSPSCSVSSPIICTRFVPFDYLARPARRRNRRDGARDPRASRICRPAFPLTRIRARASAIAWQTQGLSSLSLPTDRSCRLDFMPKPRTKGDCWLPLTTVHGRLGVLSFRSASATDYQADASGIHGAGRGTCRSRGRQRDQLRPVTEIRAGADGRKGPTASLIDQQLARHGARVFCSSEGDLGIDPALIDHDCVNRTLRSRLGRLAGASRYDVSRGPTWPDVTVPLDRSPAGVALERRVTTVFHRSALTRSSPWACRS